ncbi:cadherin-like domain-containing protein, partial [Photobacterium leiognathi]
AEVRNKTSIRYIPGDFIGVDQFTYLVSDGKGDTAAGTITVTVSNTTPGNSIPKAESLEVTGINENATTYTPIVVTDKVSDADGDALRIVSILGGVGEANISTTDPLEILYMPKKARGEDTFSYVVTDDKGGYAIGVVKVVLTQNAAPVARIAKVDTKHNLAKAINLADYISDAETATSSLVVSDLSTPTAPATATLAGQVITFKPNGFVGVETLTYKVSDGEHETEGTVIVSSSADEHNDFTVRDIALNIDLDTYDGNPVTVNWLANVQTSAPAGDTFKLVNAVGAALGTVSTTGGNLTYTPRAGMYGQDRFVITVSDSRSPINYAQGFVNVTLTPPPPPEITELTVTGEPKAGSVLTPNITCDECATSKYKYEWSVNGLTVGTGATYTYRAEDAGFNIRLNVTGEDTYGQKTSAYVVYGVSKTDKLFANQYAFTAKNTIGAVTAAWGKSGSGNDISSVESDLSSGVVDIAGTGWTGWDNGAFAALKEDGSVVVWGNTSTGGSAASVASDLQSGVEHVVGNRGAFAALKADGSVVSWGSTEFGGDSSSVLGLDSGVVSLHQTVTGFIAVKNDGSAIAWGKSGTGADGTQVSAYLTSDVEGVYDVSLSVIALKKANGGAVIWGDGRAAPLVISEGVKTVITSSVAAVVLKDDGSVQAWGLNGAAKYFYRVRDQLQSGVIAISEAGTATNGSYSGGSAFAALKDDGTVIFWGDDVTTQRYPTITDSVAIDGSLNSFVSINALGEVTILEDYSRHSINEISSTSNIKTITRIPKDAGFALSRNDGTLHLVGRVSQRAPTNLGVVSQWSARSFAYAALNTEGKVFSWGEPSQGIVVPNLAQPSFYELESSFD